MTKEKAKEVLESIECELSIVTNNTKASEKAWDRIVKACKIVLIELNNK